MEYLHGPRISNESGYVIDPIDLLSFAPLDNDSLIISRFMSPENSHYLFIPSDVCMVMAKHLKCYLDYFREIEPDYDYSNMVEKGGKMHIKKPPPKKTIKKQKQTKRKNKYNKLIILH